MRILVIGGGGREHALVWKLKQSPKANAIYCAPGNAGILRIAQPVDAPVEGDFGAIVAWAKNAGIDLVVVGPDRLLAEGIVDRFGDAGIRAFGPSAAAARIESSKAFAKEVMAATAIPTARYATFSVANEALRYVEEVGAPVVIKANGLAEGKGVTVARSLDEARAAVRANLEEGRFGESSREILIEEFLVGEEATILAFTDGRTVLMTESCQDHKPVFDNDKGPNTGGMGAYSPAPVITPPIAADVEARILKPAVAEMERRGAPFRGILYAGLMITEDGPKVIEFNSRFGDPETQVLLPRLKNDLVDLIMACLEGRLNDFALKWSNESAVCVAMVSEGYPGPYNMGRLIEGLDTLPDDDRAVVFHAGTAIKDGRLVTNGGRVLGLTTLDRSLEAAIERNYSLLPRIRFEGAHFRKDIGQKALARLAKR